MHKPIDEYYLHDHGDGNGWQIASRGPLEIPRRHHQPTSLEMVLYEIYEIHLTPALNFLHQ